jgi:hypothetical protein
LVLLPVVVAAEGNQRDTIAPAEDGVCYERLFRSEAFLYSIVVPSGLKCCHQAAPSAVHGCSVELAGERQARLWVDGSYNTMDFDSADAALRWSVGRRLTPGATLSVLRRETTSLGDLAAVRLTLRLGEVTSSGATVEDIVIGIGAPRQGRGEIIYTLGLISPAADYSKHQETFERFVGSWKEE